MTEKERLNAIDEVIEYCEQTENYSYYDMKTYALLNGKENWIEMLKHKGCRSLVSSYLKGLKHSHKAKYKTTFEESFSTYLDAMIEHNKKVEGSN